MSWYLGKTQRHHLLKCQCTIDCQNDTRSMGGGIVNRDVNASRNILLLAECLINGHPRPAAFTRTTRLYIRASSIFSNDGDEPENYHATNP